MLELTGAQLETLAAGFLWPLSRILGFFLIAPVLSYSRIPPQVKVLLGVTLTIAIYPILPPPPDYPLFSGYSLVFLIQQTLIGVALGFAMRVTFAAVEMAGEYVAMKMGLGFANFFSQDADTNSQVLSRLFHLMTILIFLAINGHILMIETLVYTFEYLPIGTVALNRDPFELVVTWGGIIFSAGLLMSLPLVAPLLIVSISLGILNRTAPQMSVFSVGFPMTLTMGLILLMVVLPSLGQFMIGLFDQAQGVMAQIAEGFRAGP